MFLRLLRYLTTATFCDRVCARAYMLRRFIGVFYSLFINVSEKSTFLRVIRSDKLYCVTALQKWCQKIQCMGNYIWTMNTILLLLKVNFSNYLFNTIESLLSSYKIISQYGYCVWELSLNLFVLHLLYVNFLRQLYDYGFYIFLLTCMIDQLTFIVFGI